MRASVDLPEPDSPTMPSVSPRRIAKSTPSTAFSSRRGSRSISRVIQGLETSKTRREAVDLDERGGVASCRASASACSQHAARALADREQRRPLGLAARETRAGSADESAAARDRGQARHRAGNLREARSTRRLQRRDRRHQPLRVGVQRRGARPRRPRRSRRSGPRTSPRRDRRSRRSRPCRG